MHRRKEAHMNTCRKIKGLTLAALLGGAMVGSPAFADEQKYAGPPGGGYHGMMMGGYGMMGPGMMMGDWGMGMMGGWGADGPWGPAPELGLSDEQKKKIDALATAAREAGRADWQAMWEARQKMHTAMSGDKVDRAAATAAFRQMNEAMTRQMERSLDFREKVDAVLTDKQRATLRDWHRAGGGCGPGPGPGRMMGR
jgi:Spy/CpxP family protein refolding chaperone